ncbi:hypothetical protein M2L00_001397, partial [Campylobacter lari]|nr:hypothetical protein [Campylobacter lari]
MSVAGEILTIDEVFTSDFIKKHCLDSKYYSYNNDIYNLSFSDCEDNFYRRKWGLHVGPEVPYSVMKDLSKNECLLELKKCYEEIQWSVKCKNILNDVEKAYRDIGVDFVALHMRGGEIVKGDFKIAPEVWMKERHFPYEVAMEIVKQLNFNEHIIIFGQDYVANQKLENYLNGIKQNNIKIISIDTLIVKYGFKYSNDERTFFELNLMSKSKYIYSTGKSMYSNVAGMISGKDIIKSFYNYYSNEEIYMILL